MKRICFFATVAPIALAGCMGGEMQGLMNDGSRVVMTYEEDLSFDKYSTVIDGEAFTGKAVSIDTSLSSGSIFSSANAFGSGGYASGFGSGTAFGVSSGGKYKAILLGSRGSTLTCLMQYADVNGFASLGGIGECQHSDGRTVSVTW